MTDIIQSFSDRNQRHQINRGDYARELAERYPNIDAGYVMQNNVPNSALEREDLEAKKRLENLAGDFGMRDGAPTPPEPVSADPNDIFDPNAEIQEDALYTKTPQGQDFAAASRVMYNKMFSPDSGSGFVYRGMALPMFSDREVPQTDEDFARFGVEFMGQFNYNITKMGIDVAKLQGLDENTALAFYSAMTMYDRLPDFTWNGTKRMTQGIASDPTTIAGLGTLGWAFLGRAGAKQTTKTAFKEYLKSALASSTAVGAIEGGVYGGLDNYFRQQVAVDAEIQDGINLSELGTAATVGTLAGGVLGKGSDLLGDAVSSSAPVVQETLAQAPPPTDTQVMPDQSFFDKAGEATDNFVTQAATTTDEVATSAARATDEFVSPTAQPAAGRAVPGDLSKQIDDARAAYEAAPNDPQLRIDYFDLRKQRDADPVAQAQPPTDAEPGIIAFHGSAADFDQFRLEKIGTGEGNQIYGWGLYFADKEAIADFYRGALTDAPYDYKIDGQSVSEMYRNAVYAENYELADVLEQVQLHDTPKTLKAKFTVENGYAKETANFVADLDYGKLTGVDVDGEEIPLGRIYKVGLTPKPDDLLDYDKSFSEQTPAIQTALRKIGHKPERELTVTRDGDERVAVYEVGDSGQNKFVKHFIDGVMGVSGEVQANTYIKTLEKQSFEATGGDIVNFMANEITRKAGSSNVNGAEMLSKNLLEAGIPGIKYLENNDNESVKQSNYVIFDDSMIKILEKYGIVGPVAISAMDLSEEAATPEAQAAYDSVQTPTMQSGEEAATSALQSSVDRLKEKAASNKGGSN